MAKMTNNAIADNLDKVFNELATRYNLDGISDDSLAELYTRAMDLPFSELDEIYDTGINYISLTMSKLYEYNGPEIIGHIFIGLSLYSKYGLSDKDFIEWCKKQPIESAYYILMACGFNDNKISHDYKAKCIADDKAKKIAKEEKAKIEFEKLIQVLQSYPTIVSESENGEIFLDGKKYHILPVAQEISNMLTAIDDAYDFAYDLFNEEFEEKCSHNYIDCANNIIAVLQDSADALWSQMRRWLRGQNVSDKIQNKIKNEYSDGVRETTEPVKDAVQEVILVISDNVDNEREALNHFQDIRESTRLGTSSVGIGSQNMIGGFIHLAAENTIHDVQTLAVGIAGAAVSAYKNNKLGNETLLSDDMVDEYLKLVYYYSLIMHVSCINNLYSKYIIPFEEISGEKWQVLFKKITTRAKSKNQIDELSRLLITKFPYSPNVYEFFSSNRIGIRGELATFAKGLGEIDVIDDVASKVILDDYIGTEYTSDFAIKKRDINWFYLTEFRIFNESLTIQLPISINKFKNFGYESSTDDDFSTDDENDTTDDDYIEDTTDDDTIYDDTIVYAFTGMDSCFLKIYVYDNSHKDINDITSTKDETIKRLSGYYISIGNDDYLENFSDYVNIINNRNDFINIVSFHSPKHDGKIIDYVDKKIELVIVSDAFDNINSDNFFIKAYDTFGKKCLAEDDVKNSWCDRKKDIADRLTDHPEDRKIISDNIPLTFQNIMKSVDCSNHLLNKSVIEMRDSGATAKMFNNIPLGRHVYYCSDQLALTDKEFILKDKDSTHEFDLLNLNELMLFHYDNDSNSSIKYCLFVKHRDGVLEKYYFDIKDIYEFNLAIVALNISLEGVLPANESNKYLEYISHKSEHQYKSKYQAMCFDCNEIFEYTDNDNKFCPICGVGNHNYSLYVSEKISEKYNILKETISSKSKIVTYAPKKTQKEKEVITLPAFKENDEFSIRFSTLFYIVMNKICNEWDFSNSVEPAVDAFEKDIADEAIKKALSTKPNPERYVMFYAPHFIIASDIIILRDLSFDLKNVKELLIYAPSDYWGLSAHTRIMVRCYDGNNYNRRVMTLPHYYIIIPCLNEILAYLNKDRPTDYYFKNYNSSDSSNIPNAICGECGTELEYYPKKILYTYKCPKCKQKDGSVYHLLEPDNQKQVNVRSKYFIDNLSKLFYIKDTNKEHGFVSSDTQEARAKPTIISTNVSTDIGGNNASRTVFCVNCGKEISSEDKFCTYCGARNEYYGGITE
jgi:hypothetical protein